MKSILIAIGLFVVSASTSFAACDLGGCTGTIDRLVMNSNGTISIWTSGDEGQLDCDAGTMDYVHLRPEHVLRDQIYALLLSAHMDRSQVYVRITNNPGNVCEVDYVVSDK